VARGAALGTLAFALATDHVLGQAQLLRDTVVKILQVHLKGVHDVLALALALTPAAAAAPAAAAEW